MKSLPSAASGPAPLRAWTLTRSQIDGFAFRSGHVHFHRHNDAGVVSQPALRSVQSDRETGWLSFAQLAVKGS